MKLLLNTTENISSTSEGPYTSDIKRKIVETSTYKSTGDLTLTKKSN